MRGKNTDVRERSTGCCHQAEANRNLVFAHNSEAGKFRERVLGGAHPTFNTVFHGNHRVGAAPTHHVIEGLAHVCHADPFARIGAGHHA